MNKASSPVDRINAALAAANEDHSPRVGLQTVRGSAFVRELQPSDPVLDAIPATSRGRLISVTGGTGHGKTTLATAIEICIATGTKFGGADVARGRVLVLCGENPDDYNLHLVATMQEMGLEPADLDDILVVPGRFDIDAGFDWLKAEVAAFGDLSAVVVDTSAAYFNADDDNGNVQQYRHAAMLRGLTELPGRPVVFVLCHPTKSFTRDNIVPRGGGAFLNEVDANLTVWKDEAGVVTLHWAGKMRGAYFEPLRFELAARDLDGYQDGKGRPLRSAVVRAIQGDRAEQLEAKAMDDENRLLVAMQRKPDGSVADLALACGWASGAGTANKARVHRVMQKLQAQALVEKSRLGGWRLTHKGKREADQL